MVSNLLTACPWQTQKMVGMVKDAPQNQIFKGNGPPHLQKIPYLLVSKVLKPTEASYASPPGKASS